MPPLQLVLARKVYVLDRQLEEELVVRQVELVTCVTQPNEILYILNLELILWGKTERNDEVGRTDGVHDESRVVADFVDHGSDVVLHLFFRIVLEDSSVAKLNCMNLPSK